MPADREDDENLIASISDGHPIDWDATMRELDPERKPRIEALREIAGIAEFSRGLQPAADQPLPERWGDVLLLERLGGGARADVYRAWDPALRREVALKLLRPGLDHASLLEEGRAAGSIRHPSVVTVHGIDHRDDRIGLSMELVRGIDLQSDVSRHGPLSAAEAARLGGQMAGALAAVHAAGLLHRDVKPANVVRDADGRYVLVDFGLGLRGWDATQRLLGASGTPMYMAPEILAGAPPSERSDVYSLGLLLWFALAGRHPFEAESIEALSAAARRGPHPGLATLRPELPAELVGIVDRAIAPNPEDRFASAGQLAEALGEPGLTGHAAKPAAGKTVLLVLGAATLAALAFGLVRTLAPPPTLPPAAPAPPMATAAAYDVVAGLLRRADGANIHLASGDRVHPGDRLSLEFRATRPAWVYVLNEDERGELYLLFPQPAFDQQNPLAADTTLLLPGPMAGREQGWTVTSAGGREHFLIVASPEPVPQFEAELASLPAPVAGRPIQYPSVSTGALERLRGVGGISELPATPGPRARRAGSMDRFLTLAGEEAGVQGIWVRKVVLENPAP